MLGDTGYSFGGGAGPERARLPGGSESKVISGRLSAAYWSSLMSIRCTGSSNGEFTPSWYQCDFGTRDGSVSPVTRRGIGQPGRPWLAAACQCPVNVEPCSRTTLAVKWTSACRDLHSLESDGRHVTRWPLEVALARDPTSLLAWLGMRLFIAEIALIVGVQAAGTVRVLIVAAGAVVLGYAALLALHALSLRLLIFPAEVRVASLVLRRNYRLARDAPKRQIVAARRGAFQSQLGNFGIELGRGRMPSGEPVDIVRLSPLPSVIVIRCVGIWLAVVPSSEQALLSALNRARLGEPQAHEGQEP